jgi:hypothetical protein
MLRRRLVADATKFPHWNISITAISTLTLLKRRSLQGLGVVLLIQGIALLMLQLLRPPLSLRHIGVCSIHAKTFKIVFLL